MKMYNILDVINKMNESNDEMEILKYENIMSAIFAAPILFFGALANFFSMYFIFKQDLRVTLINSFFLLGFSMAFEIFSRISDNDR